MTRDRRGFSLGWVFVSYFLVAGGVVLGLLALGLIGVESSAAVHALLFAGGVIGGLVAGRASHGKTILEPAIAGGLLIASCFGLLMLVPGLRARFAVSGEQVARIFGVAAAIGVGGLVGATLGVRTAPVRQSTAWYRWAGISAMISLGVMFVAMMVVAIATLRAGGDADDHAAALGLTGIGAAALFGPLVTQLIAPARMRSAAALGVVLLMVAMAVAGAAGGREPGKVVAGAAILAGVGYAIGLLGATVGWSINGQRKAEVVQADAIARTFD